MFVRDSIALGEDITKRLDGARAGRCLSNVDVCVAKSSVFVRTCCLRPVRACVALRTGGAVFRVHESPREVVRGAI